MTTVSVIPNTMAVITNAIKKELKDERTLRMHGVTHFHLLKGLLSLAKHTGTPLIAINTIYVIYYTIGEQIMDNDTKKKLNLNGVMVAHEWLNLAIINGEKEHVIDMYRRLLVIAIEQYYLT